MEAVPGNPRGLSDQKSLVSENELMKMKREDLRAVLYQLTSQLVRTTLDNRENRTHGTFNLKSASTKTVNKTERHMVSSTDEIIQQKSAMDENYKGEGYETNQFTESLNSVCPATWNEDTGILPESDQGDITPSLKVGFHDEYLRTENKKGEVEPGNNSVIICTEEKDTKEIGSSVNMSRNSHGDNGYHNKIDLLEIFRKSSNIAQLTSELQKNLINVSNMNIHFDSYLDFAFALNRLCRFVLSVIERCSEETDGTRISTCHDIYYKDCAVYEDDIMDKLVDETSTSSSNTEIASNGTEVRHYEKQNHTLNPIYSITRKAKVNVSTESKNTFTQTDLLYQDYVNLLSVEEDIYDEVRLLKSEAEILREENKDLCDINDALRSRIEVISQNNDELFAHQDELLTEISRQREENQTLRNNFNRVLYDYNRLENEMQTLQFDYEDLNIEKELLVNRLTLKDQECKSLRDRHDSAVRKMKVMQEKFENVKSMHEEGKVMKRKDWEEWSKLRSQLSATENALQDVRRQKRKLIRDLEQMRERLRRSHCEVSKADEAACKLEERISRAKRSKCKEATLDIDRKGCDIESDQKDIRARRFVSSVYYKVRESEYDSSQFKDKVKKATKSNRVKSIIRALTSEGSDEGDGESSSSPIDDNSDFLFWGLTDRSSPDAENDSPTEQTNLAVQGEASEKSSRDIDEKYSSERVINTESIGHSASIIHVPKDDRAIFSEKNERNTQKGIPKQMCVSNIRLDLYTLEESE